jgi:hypothetical protein
MRLRPQLADAPDRMFPASGLPTCAVVCRAQRGRWRPQADDTTLTLMLILTLVFWFCPAGLTGRALLLFLTSPPRMFLDGGVRSGTVLAAPFARPGRPAGHPRAARVHSDRTRSSALVRLVCGSCAVSVLERVCSDLRLLLVVKQWRVAVIQEGIRFSWISNLQAVQIWVGGPISVPADGGDQGVLEAGWVL